MVPPEMRFGKECLGELFLQEFERTQKQIPLQTLQKVVTTR